MEAVVLAVVAVASAIQLSSASTPPIKLAVERNLLLDAEEQDVPSTDASETDADGKAIRPNQFWSRAELMKLAVSAVSASILMLNFFRLGWDIVNFGDNSRRNGVLLILEDVMLILFWVR